MTVGELKHELGRPDVRDDMLVVIGMGTHVTFLRALHVTINLKQYGAEIFGEDAVCVEGW